MRNSVTISSLTLMMLLASLGAFAQSSVTVMTAVESSSGYLTFYLLDEHGWNNQHPNRWASEDLEQPLSGLMKADVDGLNVYSATFDRLPAGQYAVVAYRDLNKDFNLNFDSNGIPLEPVGLSNNPNMVDMDFGSVAFEVGDRERVALSIEINKVEEE